MKYWLQADGIKDPSWSSPAQGERAGPWKAAPKTQPNDVRAPAGKTFHKTDLFTNLYEYWPQ
jgi:hypothetical protein